MTVDGESDYERLRQENIARNEEKLRSLGLYKKDAQKGSGSSSKKKKKRSLPPAEPTRRSSRRRTSVKSYREEALEEERRTRNEKDEDYASSDEETPAVDFEARRKMELETILERSRGWQQAHLEEVNRARKEAQDSTASTVSIADDERQSAAKAEAIRRWGDFVGKQPVTDWVTYLSSRTTTPPPPSPVALLQERYAHDGYRLLCACIMMSRVSSAATKERCITEFFEKWPTPSKFLLADPSSVQPVLLSLGLFPQRYMGLVDVAQKWICLPKFEVGLDKERKIQQIGPFGVDSYNLFGLGKTDEEPGDKNLKVFWRWRRAETTKKDDIKD